MNYYRKLRVATLTKLTLYITLSAIGNTTTACLASLIAVI